MYRIGICFVVPPHCLAWFDFVLYEKPGNAGGERLKAVLFCLRARVGSMDGILKGGSYLALVMIWLTVEVKIFIGIECRMIGILVLACIAGGVTAQVHGIDDGVAPSFVVFVMITLRSLRLQFIEGVADDGQLLCHPVLVFTEDAVQG